MAETREEYNARHREYNKRYKTIRISVSTHQLLNELRGDMSLNKYIRQLARAAEEAQEK